MACNRFPLMHDMDTDEAPDDPLAALNQGLPATLASSLADGAARLSVEFSGPFRVEGSHYQRPCTCTWLNGPAGGPEAGSLKVTFAAAAELLATTPSARWDRIHQALRRKYVLASSTFIGSDGGLMITTADLNR
jgi:hypothetical protein